MRLCFNIRRIASLREPSHTMTERFDGICRMGFVDYGLQLDIAIEYADVFDIDEERWTLELIFVYYNGNCTDLKMGFK